MTILLEVAEISRFPSPEDFASYCRRVAAIRTSNGKKKADNNRKCGNRYLAWAFIEAANLIRRYDERAKRWHARKLAKSSHASPPKRSLASWPRPPGTSSAMALSTMEIDFSEWPRQAPRPRQQTLWESIPQPGKGVEQKSRGLIGGRCSPTTFFHDWPSKKHL